MSTTLVDSDDDQKIPATKKGRKPPHPHQNTHLLKPSTKPNEKENAIPTHLSIAPPTLAPTDSTSSVTNNNNETPSQMKLPIYSKPKLSSILLQSKHQPDSAEYTRAVVAVGLRCGASILWFENHNGQPSYVWPILQDIRQDPDMARIRYKVDLTLVRRDSSDINKIWQTVRKRDSQGNTKRTLFNLFLHFPDTVNEDGPAFRRKWIELFVRLYNSPSTQTKLFGTNTLAYNAGDLTPQNSQLQYLSDYFTIKHTLNALEYAYKDKTRQEIVADNSILQYYFPSDQFDNVRKYETEAQARTANYTSFDNSNLTFDSI